MPLLLPLLQLGHSSLLDHTIITTSAYLPPFTFLIHLSFCHQNYLSKLLTDHVSPLLKNSNDPKEERMKTKHKTFLCLGPYLPLQECYLSNLTLQKYRTAHNQPVCDSVPLPCMTMPCLCLANSEASTGMTCIIGLSLHEFFNPLRPKAMLLHMVVLGSPAVRKGKPQSATSFKILLSSSRPKHVTQSSPWSI